MRNIFSHLNPLPFHHIFIKPLFYSEKGLTVAALSKPVLSHCAWAYCGHTSCRAKATRLSSALMLLFNKSSCFRDSNIACQHWCTYYFGGACASSAIHSIRKLHCALSLKPQDIPGDMGSAHCFALFFFSGQTKDSISNVNWHALCKCLPFHMHKTMYDGCFSQFLWSRS